MILKYLWPALLSSLVVLILCLMPGHSLPKVGMINFDKVVHSILFGGLTLLFATGFYRQTTYDFLNRHYLASAFVLCTLYGGLLEIAQATFAIKRSGDWLDFLFDGLGALTAVWFLNSTNNLSGYGILPARTSLQQHRENDPR